MTVGNQLLDFLIDAEATCFVKNSWLSKLSSEARMSREKAFSPATGQSDGMGDHPSRLCGGASSQGEQ